MAKDTSFIDDLRDIPGLNDMSSKTKDRGLRVTGEDPDGDFDGDFDGEDKPAKERETFPCESCGGTGRYRGVRVHQPAVECFACKGRGFFYTSYKDRLASRQKAAARKVARIEQGLDTFEALHPGLLAGMRKHASWNDFLRDLLAKLTDGLDLSDKAVEAAQRTVDKAEARDREREAARQARVAGAATVNADALKQAFERAHAKGLQRPKLRYDGFEVSRAPDHGKNAGALYVKATDDTYLGKIVAGRYLPTSEAERDGLVARVVEAMNDPLALAVAYGRRTGNCSCCGRKLTDPVSVERGIGPICAESYGW